MLQFVFRKELTPLPPPFLSNALQLNIAGQQHKHKCCLHKLFLLLPRCLLRRLAFVDFSGSMVSKILSNTYSYYSEETNIIAPAARTKVGTAAPKIYGKELRDFDDADLEGLLSKLSPEELEDLNSDLDPDVCTFSLMSFD